MFTLDNYDSADRKRAAEICGTHPEYLRQCAKGIRSPGMKLAARLIKHDNRLTLEALLMPKLRRDALIETGELQVRPYRKTRSVKYAAQK